MCGGTLLGLGARAFLYKAPTLCHATPISYYEMIVTPETTPEKSAGRPPAWLLFIFSLPAKRATERMDVWRKLRRIGALQLPSSGYVLPNTPANQEHFEWLAAAIRNSKGQASVVQVHAIDDRPDEKLVRDFIAARSIDYEELLKTI